MTTSLEILEECFDRIYTTRKNILASKHKTFTKTEDKRKQGKLSGTPARNITSRQCGSSPARHNRVGNLADTLDDGGDGDIQSPPTAKRATAHRTAAAPSSSSRRSFDHDGPKSTLIVATTVPKVIENSLDLTPNDLTATVIFDEFRTELMAWLSEKLHAQASPESGAKGQKALQKELVDACADCADYLTDKYLCLKLDPLHSSELVSKVRKTMSKIIEDFAVSGNVPDDFEEIRFYEMVGKDGDDVGGGAYSAKLGQRGNNSSLVSSIRMGGNTGPGTGLGAGMTPNSTGGLSFDSTTSGFVLGGGSSLSFASTGGKPQTKEEKEKARIKEQYAQFMNKKKTAGKGVETSVGGVVGDMIGRNQDFIAASAPAAIDTPSHAPTNAPTSSTLATSGTTPGTTAGTVGPTTAAASASATASAVASAEDQAKAAQLSDLNDDIRSLLSSIQGKPAATGGDKLALTAPAASSAGRK